MEDLKIVLILGVIVFLFYSGKSKEKKDDKKEGDEKGSGKGGDKKGFTLIELLVVISIVSTVL